MNRARESGKKIIASSQIVTGCSLFKSVLSESSQTCLSLPLFYYNLFHYNSKSSTFLYDVE